MTVAARRLLIVMLVLLGISSVIAVVTPNPRKEATEREQQATGTSGATGGTGATATTGATGADPGSSGAGQQVASPAAPGPLEKDITVAADSGTRSIAARPGQRLVLTVATPDAREVTIPGLGLSSFADRYAPARFDVVLPAEPGRIPVFASAPGGPPSADPVARINVEG